LVFCITDIIENSTFKILVEDAAGRSGIFLRLEIGGRIGDKVVL